MLLNSKNFSIMTPKIAQNFTMMALHILKKEAVTKFKKMLLFSGTNLYQDLQKKHFFFFHLDCRN